MSIKPTYDQYEAAFWLVAQDYCFLFFKDGSPFVSHPSDCRRAAAYQVAANMNDTFYFACADCEDLDWAEVIPMRLALEHFKALDDSRGGASFDFLVHWASHKRGHDPQIPQVKVDLDSFREKYAADLELTHIKSLFEEPKK